MTSLNALAHSTLRRLLESPDTPPAVQLRAAQTVLKSVPAEPAPEPESLTSLERLESLIPETFRYSTRKPGRNEPCPCGSGRKFKFCCLANPAPLATPNTT